MQASAVMVGAVGHGIVYITGLSYIHIRSEGFRVPRIAMCHVMYLTGLATTAHSLHEFDEDWFERRPDGMWDYAHLPLGYHLLAYPALALTFVGMLFLLQGRLFDYRKILDYKLSVADMKADNFKSTLSAPVRQGSVPKADTFNQLKLTNVMLFSKLKGGLFANNMLIMVASIGSRELFAGNSEHGYIIHYFSLLGLIFGFFASYFIQLKVLFIPSAVGYLSMVLVAVTLFTTDNPISSGVFLWLFFLIIGISIHLPDVGLMEVAPISYYELFLSLGYAVEAVPLIIATYLTNRDVEDYTTSLWIGTSLLVAGLVLVIITMFFWYPNTLKKTALDIQFQILYKDKIIAVHPAVPEVEIINVELGGPIPYPEVTPIPQQPNENTPVVAPIIQSLKQEPVQPASNPDAYQAPATAPSMPNTPSDMYPTLPHDEKPKF